MKDPNNPCLFCNTNNKILESGTSNFFFVSKNKVYSPINNFYKGTNVKFFEKKIKIIKKNIFLKKVNNFEEIILVGSGKGVVQVKNIKKIGWKRKKNNIFKKLSFIYKREIQIQKNINQLL